MRGGGVGGPAAIELFGGTDVMIKHVLEVRLVFILLEWFRCQIDCRCFFVYKLEMPCAVYFLRSKTALFKLYFVMAHYNKYWIWPRHTYFIKTYSSQTL